jgi:hypothetical protein
MSAVVKTAWWSLTVAYKDDIMWGRTITSG